jgi:hypothetical protein
MIQTEKLIQIAKAFRDAFETVGRSYNCEPFPSFPEGCCLWASLFIGQFLLDEYNLSPQRVCAQCHLDSDAPGHHWIEVENIIIDITADQIKDDYQLPKEIVCDVGDSEWHNRWESKNTYLLFNGFLEYDKIALKNGENKISDIYKSIKSEVLG